MSQYSSALFIPFEEKEPQLFICDPYSQQRKQWIQQKQHNYKSSIFPIPKQIAAIERNTEYKFYDQTYIRYHIIGSEFDSFVSDISLTIKAQKCIREENQKQCIQNQMKQREKTVLVLPEMYQDHRYFNFPSTICRYCKNKGHQINDCYKLNRFRRQKIYYGAYICYSCNKRGHIAKFCKQNRQFAVGYETCQGSDGSPKGGNPFIFLQIKHYQTGIQY